MKKYFLSIVALAGMLFATSCQESIVEPQVGGPTTFTVQVPDQMGTKADGDSYKLFVEVYSADGDESYHRIDPIVMAVGTPTTVTLDLVANQAYDIIFWAQKNDGSYGVSDLKTVQMNANHHNSETGAAFYAVLDNYNPTTQGKKDVKLTRPFAQLNLYTTNDVAYGKVNLVKSTITIEGVAEKFNRVDNNIIGEGVGSTTYEYTSNTLPTGTKTINSVEYQYVSMDYLAVPGNQNLVKVTAVIDVMDEKGNQSQITRIIEQVPVQMNYRTNIIGNLITSASDFKVEISEDWADEDKTVEFREVSTADELIAAVNAGVEEIELVADIELKQPIVFPAAPTQSQIARASTTEVPSSYVLDLNGKTINAGYEAGSTTKHIYAFVNYANLTIKGNGTINARGIDNYGVLTLENGTINAIDGNGGYAVINYDGSEFIMNDGTVATTNEDGDAPESGNIDATPIRVEQGAKAVINGGTINNICNYTCVLDNHGDVTINGGEFKSYWSAFLNYNAMTIKGGNVTVLAAESIVSSVHPIYAGENSITIIEGGTFNARTDKASCYSIAANNGNEASVSISGGTFSKTGGGKHFSGDKLTVEVTGGTFSHDPTASLKKGYKAVKAADNETYVVIPDTDDYEIDENSIVISDPTQLITSEVINRYNTIYLAEGEYTINLYDGITHKTSLTIVGTEGTKVAHTASNPNTGQLRLELFDSFTIKNCEILKRKHDKNWGMLVFGAGKNANGEYTIENCTFNGVGTQGIYINETVSGAKYNIRNCTFNGNFGDQGAITIQTNKDVNHIVTVEDCNFNNVPADHRIVLTPNGALFYDFTLNTDLEATTVYEFNMFVKLGLQNIRLADGVYNAEYFYLKGKNINISAVNSGNVTINSFVHLNGGKYTFNGIKFTNTNAYQSNPDADGEEENAFKYKSCVGVANMPTEVLFEDCKFAIENVDYAMWAHCDTKSTFENCYFECNHRRPIATNGPQTIVNNCVFNNQYHYALRLFENKHNSQYVEFTNNAITGTRYPGKVDSEGINISKKDASANITGKFVIKGNTDGLKYRHHEKVTMDASCVYDTDIENFAFEREQ